MAEPDNFAEWLRSYRRERKMTQQELADAAGLGRTYIIALEKGRIRLPQRENRAKLHQVLGTDDSELEDFGLLAIDDFGNEWTPEPEPTAAEVAPISPIFIDGMTSNKGEGEELIGAAMVYIIRGMNPRQRKALIDVMNKIDNELDSDDVPF